MAVVDAGLECRCLAEVSSELDDANLWIRLHDRGQALEGPIGAAIVDVDDLAAPAEPFDGGAKALVEQRQGLLLVEERDHDRDGRRVARYRR